MSEIESVTVLPDGVTSIQIAGVDIPVVLQAGETIRYIKVSIDKRQWAMDAKDGKTAILMEWMEY